MKAVFLVKTGEADEAFEIRETNTPEPGDQDIRIKVEAFGLNYADVLARKGKYRDCPPLPCVIGYDVVGIIDKVGAEVKGLKTGDRVTSLTRFNGYAEYVVVDYRGAAQIPEELPLTFVGAMATQYCTAYYASQVCIHVFPGEKVLVNAAAGGVGTALVQLLKLNGAIVFGTCSSEEKVTYLRTIGVDHPINYLKQDYSKVINEILGTGRLDVVLDPLGGIHFKKGMKLLGAGGRFVSYGASELGNANSIFQKLRTFLRYGFYHPLLLMAKSKTLAGVYMLPLADYHPEILQYCLREVIQMAADGKIKAAGGMEFPVSQIAQAHSALENRKTIGKVMVKWSIP